MLFISADSSLVMRITFEALDFPGDLKLGGIGLSVPFLSG